MSVLGMKQGRADQGRSQDAERVRNPVGGGIRGRQPRSKWLPLMSGAGGGPNLVGGAWSRPGLESWAELWRGLEVCGRRCVLSGTL
jgi:hypothetical protein